MKPLEFWDSTYREVCLYVESLSLHEEQTLKANIMLLENLGNKLINASMVAKNPKNTNLIRDIYPDLFKEELERQSAFTRKASEGEELVNLMLELTEELKQETIKRNNEESLKGNGGDDLLK